MEKLVVHCVSLSGPMLRCLFVVEGWADASGERFATCYMLYFNNSHELHSRNDLSYSYESPMNQVAKYLTRKMFNII